MSRSLPKKQHEPWPPSDVSLSWRTRVLARTDRDTSEHSDTAIGESGGAR